MTFLTQHLGLFIFYPILTAAFFRGCMIELFIKLFSEYHLKDR